MNLNVVWYKPLKASSYIDLPESIKSKKVCVKVQNVDNDKCLVWAVLSAEKTTSSSKIIRSVWHTFLTHLSKIGSTWMVSPHLFLLLQFLVLNGWIIAASMFTFYGGTVHRKNKMLTLYIFPPQNNKSTSICYIFLRSKESCMTYGSRTWVLSFMDNHHYIGLNTLSAIDVFRNVIRRERSIYMNWNVKNTMHKERFFQNPTPN